MNKYTELRILMLRNGISMKSLADMTGIEYSLLLRRMNGNLKFTEDDIYRVCLALTIEPCKYFFGNLKEKLTG